MIDNREVGRKIAELRQQSGLTQMQLAAQMNVSHQAVSKWEGGQAMPDIQTLMELTRFFGITVEQLIGAEGAPEAAGEEASEREQGADAQCAGARDEPKEAEANQMDIQQLLQMAPYMSKEAVAEIAMGMEGKLSAGQIARLAPYLPQECVDALIEKHHPEFTWDSLRRLAPHMRREKVDELARAIASGRETVKCPEDSFNKAMNDIGRAFDDLGRGMDRAFDGLGKGVDKAVRKAIRFGESMFDGVSSAINDLAGDAGRAPEEKNRSERARALRRSAFERALEDGRWDWLGEHIGELDGGDELCERIAERALEMGMHDWIRAHMPDHAGKDTASAAIQAGDWDWLGDNLERLAPEPQRDAARAALAAGEAQWLRDHAAQIDFGDAAAELVRALREAGEWELAERIAGAQMAEEEIDEYVREAEAAGDSGAGERMWEHVSPAFVRERLLDLARAGDWTAVRERVGRAGAEDVEALMEIAVGQGDFDAVDLLDQYL